MMLSRGIRFFPNLQDQQPMSHHELEFMTLAPKNDKLWATVSGKGSISPTSVDPNRYSTYMKLLVGVQHWYVDPSCCVMQLSHMSPIMSLLSEEHFMENVYKSIIDEHKQLQEAIRNNTPFPAVKRLQRPSVTSTNINMVRCIGQDSSRTAIGLAKVHFSTLIIKPSPLAFPRLADIQSLHS